jgi:hypothetical protein
VQLANYVQNPGFKKVFIAIPGVSVTLRLDVIDAEASAVDTAARNAYPHFQLSCLIGFGK